MDISRIYANQSQPNEKSFGWKRKIVRRRMRKSSAEKSPKTSPKQEKKPWKWSEKSQNGRFGIHLAISKSSRKRHRALPERHAMRPTRPSFRQKGSLSPHSLTNRKPQNRWELSIFLHAPTRPQMNDSQRGETYFLTFCRFPPLMVPPLIHWKCTARPVWHPQRIPGFHGKTNCCKTR